LIWVKSDAPTLLRRLKARGSERDVAKLAAFDAFIARMRPDTAPPVPAFVIDNRLTAELSVPVQVTGLVHDLAG